MAGYPDWRAFVSAAGSDIWIEIVPNINVNKRSIFIPGSRIKKKAEGISVSAEKTVLDEISEKFFSTIPEEIINSISLFPDSHWELIKAIRMIGDDFPKMIKSNPALAYLLVNMEKLNRSFFLYGSIELLQRMIRTKRKEILRLCGFPETQEMVRIFSKIHIDILDIKLLIKLRDALLIFNENRERTLQILSFARNISKNLLLLLSSYQELLLYLSDKSIFDLNREDGFKEKLAALWFLYIKSKEFNIPFAEIKSLENLEEKKAVLEAKIRNQTKFSPPLLHGNEIIQPLCYEEELVSWSKRQGNCIRYSVEQVRKNRRYFYRVLYYKEEATFEIIINNDGLKLGQLLGKRNTKVSDNIYCPTLSEKQGLFALTKNL